MTETLHYNLRAGSTPRSPIAFLVHGRAGNISVMTTFARALPEDWTLVFVQAPLADPIGGFSWWDINNPLTKERQQVSSFEQLRELIADIPSIHGLLPQFVVAIGFSQGAAMLSMLAQESDLSLRAIALLSGFIITRPITRTADKPSMLVIHGTADEIVPISRISEGVAYLKDQGYLISLHSEDVGHKVGVQGMRVLKEWAKSL